MAVKIRAKQSLASNEYGKLRAGEYGYCKPSTAKYLEEKGMADIVAEDVEAPVKKIKEHLFMNGYEPKQESKPVLYQEEAIPIKTGIVPTDVKIDGEPGSEEIEPEQAAGKKEMTDEEKEKKEQKEAPKKQYK